MDLTWKESYSQVADPVLTLFSNYRIVIDLAPIAVCETAANCSDFEMEDVDGTTIDNTAGFVTSGICVDLSLRLRLLTVSSACRDDRGGIGCEGMSL